MRSEITTIVFSKNRACQLDLLLMGLNIPVTVIYTYDPEFEAGYKKLIGMYPNVNFILQSNFKEQMVSMVKAGNEFTMFLCDDDIMVEPFDENCKEFKEFKNNSQIICLSLRLTPMFRRRPIKDGSNTWKWKGIRKDWGYSMSVSSHIFRKSDILPLMEEGVYDIPSDLEVALKAKPIDRSLMLCFEQPKIINNLANQVQKKYPLRTIGVSVDMLEKKFLEGHRLDRKYIIGLPKKGIAGPFVKVHYKWNPRWLSNFRKNIYSQFGEDGVLEKIFEVLDIKKGWLVDVGAGRVHGSNTFRLIKLGWKGLLIDSSRSNVKRMIVSTLGLKVACKRLTVVPTGRKSLDHILSKVLVPNDFDLLSIDIDGNDYYVWKSIKKYQPKVVIIEFNPVLKLGNFLQSFDGKGGSSFTKLVELGKEKGYELISATWINAFFVKKELYSKFGIEDNAPEKIFIKSRVSYGGDLTKYK